MKPLNPEDFKEVKAQIRAEPKYWRSIWEANTPKVTVENDIFPRPDETYNCVNCKKGKKLPRIQWCGSPVHKDEQHYRCKADSREHVFLPFQDITLECQNDAFTPIIKRLHKGYQPGVDI